MLYDFLKFLAVFILKTFFAFRVEHGEIIPRAQPFLLASNHISILDPIVVGSAVPVKLAYVAKEELFNNKWFAWLLRNIGVIPLDRGKSDIGAIRVSLRILKNKPLLIFPQGTRSNEYDHFKNGAGFLCKKGKVPVFAAKVYGTDKILPKGRGWFKRGKIKVVFGKVDNIEEDDRYEDITRKVGEALKSL